MSKRLLVSVITVLILWILMDEYLISEYDKVLTDLQRVMDEMLVYCFGKMSGV